MRGCCSTQAQAYLGKLACACKQLTWLRVQQHAKVDAALFVQELLGGLHHLAQLRGDQTCSRTVQVSACSGSGYRSVILDSSRALCNRCVLPHRREL